MTDTAIKKSRNSYSVPDVQRTVTTEDGEKVTLAKKNERLYRTAPFCLLYTSPSPRDATLSRMPSSA